MQKPRASRRQHAAAGASRFGSASASLLGQLAPGATAAAARAAAAAAARACGCPPLLLPEYAYALSFLRAAAPPDEAAAARQAAAAKLRKGRGRVAMALAADEAGPVFDARDAAAAARECLVGGRAAKACARRDYMDAAMARVAAGRLCVLSERSSDVCEIGSPQHPIPTSRHSCAAFFVGCLVCISVYLYHIPSHTVNPFPMSFPNTYSTPCVFLTHSPR